MTPRALQVTPLFITQVIDLLLMTKTMIIMRKSALGFIPEGGGIKNVLQPKPKEFTLILAVFTIILASIGVRLQITHMNH